MKLGNTNIENLAKELCQELLRDINAIADNLQKMSDTFLLGRPSREIDDVSISNIPKLLQEYSDLRKALSDWLVRGVVLQDRIGPFSIFDTEILGQKKTITYFVIPVSHFPNETVRIDGYEKARLSLRKSVHLSGYSIVLIPLENDFMGLKVNDETVTDKENQKSAAWVPGFGGDKGGFSYSRNSAQAKVLHVYT